MQNVLRESFRRTTHGYSLGMHHIWKARYSNGSLERKRAFTPRRLANMYTNVSRPMTAATDSFLVLFWDYGSLGKAAS